MMTPENLTGRARRRAKRRAKKALDEAVSDNFTSLRADPKEIMPLDSVKTWGIVMNATMIRCFETNDAGEFFAKIRECFGPTPNEYDPTKADNAVHLQDEASRGASITDDSHSISPPSAETATVSPHVGNQGVPEPVTRISGEDGSPSTQFSGSTQQPYGLGASRWAIAGDPVDLTSHFTSTGSGKHHSDALDLSMWAPRARSGARSADRIVGPPTVDGFPAVDSLPCLHLIEGDGPKSDDVVGSGVHPCPRG